MSSEFGIKTGIGFEEALALVLANVEAGEAEDLPLPAAVGRVAAEDVQALVDSPSVSTSRKDGYAVVPEDLAAASPQNPVRLKLSGRLSAGNMHRLRMGPGQAVRVTTGALIPVGAGAVIAEEFCRSAADAVICLKTAEPGRNIQRRGSDVETGQLVAARGARLTPPVLGLIAAAGRRTVCVHRPPRAAVIATGDEVVAPGEPLATGKLYASNLVEIGAWLGYFGIPFDTALVGDRREDIRAAIQTRLDRAEVFITSGGAWGSEKDLILQVAAEMNWTGIFHRVRMSPGKPVGFGLLAGRPLFVLPGGPPSNEMAFLQLCLPALMKMMGRSPRVFPVASARLRETVTGEQGWTDFVHARLETAEAERWVSPARLISRLKSMAEKQALIIISEDREKITAGETATVQILDPLAPA